MATKKFLITDSIPCWVDHLYVVECEEDEEDDYDPLGQWQDNQGPCIKTVIGRVIDAHGLDNTFLDYDEIESPPLSDRQVDDMIASLATALRDLYRGYPVKELHEHPRDLLARVIAYFDERGELDDDMRATWTVD